MKVIMYGTHLCKDTLYAIYKLEDQGADLEFRNISASLTEMKAFLKIRDEVALFDGPKKEGKIGVPYFELENGVRTLNLQEVLEQIQHETTPEPSVF